MRSSPLATALGIAACVMGVGCGDDKAPDAPPAQARPAAPVEVPPIWRAWVEGLATRAESDDARSRYFAVQYLARSMPPELGVPLVQQLDFEHKAASEDAGHAAAAWLRDDPGRVRAVFPTRFQESRTVDTLLARAAERTLPDLGTERVAGRWTRETRTARDAMTFDPDGSQAWSTEPVHPVPKNSWNSRGSSGTWCTWKGFVWTFTDRLDSHSQFAFLEAYELVGDELHGIDSDVVYRRADK